MADSLASPLPCARGLLALCVLAAPLLSPAAPLTVSVSDAGGLALAGAVVAVEVKGARAPAGAKAEMAQKDKRFVPEVLVVSTGTAVSLPNLDTVRHHVYSFSPAKTFEIKLYVGTPATPVVFDKPGVAVLGCNIHDTMVGHVVVVDTPFFGRSDASGKVVIDVPAGEHVVKVWHARMAETAGPQVVSVAMGVNAQSLSVRTALK